jgi:hypothetical protein
MTAWSKTSIVYNQPSKLLGLPDFYYRKRNCDTNLTSNTPANQYQIQKQIQNTVRVHASLYTANVAPLNAYTQPTKTTNNVCWNQMSDRPIPSVQRVTVSTGYFNSINNRHHSITSSKPGSQTPGGIGCDIKHNSYDRYLNRLKGKGPLRRGIIPTTFGTPIPFNLAYPVYGGKVTKTNIVTGCNCPISNKESNLSNDIKIYDNPLWYPEPSGNYVFIVGEYVYAIQSGNNYYTRAQITAINDGIYTVEFDNGNTENIRDISTLLIYFPCNCNGTINGETYSSGFLNKITDNLDSSCIYPNITSNFSQVFN